MSMRDARRRLLWHGMFLFLLGLLTGLVEQKFENVRMGLAAHLEGVMNGIFLVALGAVWNDLRLAPRASAAAFWAALYGTYGNWAAVTFAAVVGASSLSPITGAGHRALPWQETLLTAAFLSVGVAIIGCSVIVLRGLRRAPVAP